MKNSVKVWALILILSLTVSCKDDDEDQGGEDARFEKVNEGNTDMETIKDLTTNLEWINGVGGCFAGVVNPGMQCSESMFAGLNDWRLPTPTELSELIIAIDAKNMELNYINSSCALMSTSMPKWVMTENSNNPGTITETEPGNAGLRCVRNN
ncbi:MAG: hypothetical protein V3U80_09440 [Flavobacteriaceae bacterium]